MTGLKITVEEYLRSQPLFRERANKDRGLVNLLMKRYPMLRKVIEDKTLSKDTVISIVQDYSSMDRVWRQALERHEDLRGKDYDAKDDLEARKLDELGYQHAPTQP